jgi:holo-[acyl-carrier protein] synthase
MGCDLVDIARFAETLARRPGFLDRVFTVQERADATRDDAPMATVHARLAARFAAKEATRKALGDLRLPFHAAEVRTGPDGAPHLYLDGAPAVASLSLSHDGGVAMAIVAIEPPAVPAVIPTQEDDHAA